MEFFLITKLIGESIMPCLICLAFLLLCKLRAVSPLLINTIHRHAGANKSLNFHIQIYPYMVENLTYQPLSYTCLVSIKNLLFPSSSHLFKCVQTRGRIGKIQKRAF